GQAAAAALAPRAADHRAVRDLPLSIDARAAGHERGRRCPRGARRALRRAHRVSARAERGAGGRPVSAQPVRAHGALCGAAPAAHQRDPARHRDVRREPPRDRARPRSREGRREAMTSALIVVDDPAEWPLEVGSAEVVSADAYLRDPRYSERRRRRVCNLCDSYRYQSVGYYVSLLATARGHRAMPSVTTIQDMKSRSLFRPSDDLDELIQRSLHDIASPRFELSIYFGRNLAERHAKLSRALFNLFPVPLMRASFTKGTRWRLASLAPIPVGDIPDSHRAFLHEVVEEHFSGRGPAGRQGRSTQYEHDLAILVKDAEGSPPSNREALKRLERAARANGFDVQLLGRDDYGRLAEFDALFIRETTNVNHHTYRFASRARSEGLVVIDDPESIIRCGNKVYLFELAKRLNLPIPPTLVVDSGKPDEIIAELGLPCVLKQPDSAF